MIGCIRLRAGTVAVSARPGWRATAAEPWQLAAGAWRAAAVRATLCGGARANHGGPLGQRLVHTNLRASGAAAVTTSPGAHVDAAAVRGDDGWAGAGARAASSMAGSVSTQLPDGGPGSGHGAPATGASAADDRHPELRGHVDASEVLPYASHPPPEPEDAEAEFPFGVRNKPTGLKYFKHRGTWAAQITVDGEYIHLGTYDDGLEAAEVRATAARLCADGKTADEVRQAMALPQQPPPKVAIPTAVQRVATRRVVGVKYYKTRGIWAARITVGGESVHLGSFTDIESAAEMRKRAEKLVRAGADAKELRVALKLPPPRVQRRKTLHGVYEHAGAWVARFHRQGKDYYVGTYDTEEQARVAYQEAIEDFAKFEGRYGGVVEFVADPVMETVALDPESAEFPYGTINRPEGLRFNRGNRKWTAVIHVNYEIVHMGTFVNGTDAYETRKRAQELVAAGASAAELRKALGLRPPGSAPRRIDRDGFYRGLRGQWVARIMRHGEEHELGRFGTEQAARDACRAAVAEFEAEDKDRIAQRAATLQVNVREKAKAAQARLQHASKAGATVEAEEDEGVYETHPSAHDKSQQAFMKWARGEMEGVDPPGNSRELVKHGGQGSGKWIDWDSLPFPLGTMGRPMGVRLTKSTGRWHASITVGNEMVHLGTHDDGDTAEYIRQRALELAAMGKEPEQVRAALSLPSKHRQKTPARNRGYHYVAKQRLWQASIEWQGKNIDLGMYRNQEDAHQAYTYACARLDAERAVVLARERLQRLPKPPEPVLHPAHVQPPKPALPSKTAAAWTKSGASGWGAASGGEPEQQVWSTSEPGAAVTSSDAAVEEGGDHGRGELLDAYENLFKLAAAHGGLDDDSMAEHAGSEGEGEQYWEDAVAAESGASGSVSDAGASSMGNSGRAGGEDGSDGNGSDSGSDGNGSGSASDFSESGSDSGGDFDSEYESDSDGGDELPEVRTNLPPRQDLLEVNTVPNHELPKKSVPREQVPGFMGVWKRPPKGGDTMIYEALIMVHGTKVSGGIYESVDEAAYAYDSLARMYHGPAAPTNFSEKSYKQWLPPTVDPSQTDLIPVVEGKLLTVHEVVDALKALNGIDVVSLNLEGRSDLAEHMVFVTGRSVPHMRKMADTVVKALRLRGIKPNGNVASVEGRECDDWMVVDAINVIVNVFDDEARECYDLEKFYEDMRVDVDPWEGMTYDEWLERHPIPEKWLRRLERDEMED